MTGAPRKAWLATLGTVGIFGVVFGLTQAAGCRKEAPAAQKEDAAERNVKARALFGRADVAPIPEKYDLFRRVIQLYDDTEAGKSAYLVLVVTMTRDQPPRFSEALDLARQMRDRHPGDREISECFKQIADQAYVLKDDATRKTAIAEWAKYVEERDIAGDVPKAQLYFDLLNVRIRQERWEDALVAADTALNEPELSKIDRVEVLVRKGNLLGDKLGKKDAARTAFQSALELAKQNHSASSGIRGLSPAQVEAEIKRLDGG